MAIAPVTGKTPAPASAPAKKTANPLPLQQAGGFKKPKTDTLQISKEAMAKAAAAKAKAPAKPFGPPPAKA